MGKVSRSFVVIGLGAFGRVVAQGPARFGNRVIGIDRDPRRVAALAEQLPAALILDAADEGALREAGIDRYDVGLVSIGNDLERSVIAAMNLRLVGVGTIRAKADSRTHHRILSRIGADRVILPGLETGRHTAQMLNNPAVQDDVSLGNGYSVVNLMIPQRPAGRHLSELGAGPGVQIPGMMRGTDHRCRRDRDPVLLANDRILRLGRRVELTHFGDRL